MTVGFWEERTERQLRKRPLNSSRAGWFQVSLVLPQQTRLNALPGESGIQEKEPRPLPQDTGLKISGSFHNTADQKALLHSQVLPQRRKGSLFKSHIRSGNCALLTPLPPDPHLHPQRHSSSTQIKPSELRRGEHITAPPCSNPPPRETPQ